MYLLTLKSQKDEGAYAVQDKYGDRVLFLFEEEDDAERYAMMLEEQGDPEMEVITVADKVAIGACERTGTRYTVISKNDIVIPPKPTK